MRKLTVACCILVSLVSANLWLLQLCTPSEETHQEPDCCKDGFCPRRAHVESPGDSPGDDCICNLSPGDRQALMILLSEPAVLPRASNLPLISTSGVVEAATFQLVSFDEVTPAPPPKA